MVSGDWRKKIFSLPHTIYHYLTTACVSALAGNSGNVGIHSVFADIAAIIRILPLHTNARFVRAFIVVVRHNLNSSLKHLSL